MDKKNNPMMGPRSINEEESAKKLTEQEEKEARLLELRAKQLEGKKRTGEILSTSNGRIMSEREIEIERREKAGEEPLSSEELDVFIKKIHPEYEEELEKIKSEISKLGN